MKKKTPNASTEVLFSLNAPPMDFSIEKKYEKIIILLIMYYTGL